MATMVRNSRRALNWTVLIVLGLLACAYDWPWITSRGWVGLLAMTYATVYFDRRIAGKPAALAEARVDVTTPQKETDATDFGAILIAAVGVAGAFNVFGLFG